MELRQKLGLLSRVEERGTTAPTRGAPPLDSVVRGRFWTTPHGPCFVAERTYAVEQSHGSTRLKDALACNPRAAASLGRDARLESLEFGQAAFLDIETTGLAGGVGTYVFLVGVGFFDGSSFSVRQFFLRDYADEPAMLCAAGDFLSRFQGVVTFNGKLFDLPLLETRFILSRMGPRIPELLHFDLLFAARRIWRESLESCSLPSLERHVLGVTRMDDIPGALIPSVYFDYLRQRDPSLLVKVFEHNAADILSLLALATVACRTFASPERASPPELYCLARLHECLGNDGRARELYRAAARGRAFTPLGRKALRNLSFLYKRADMWEEAVEIWRCLISPPDQAEVYPYIELAKYYEHRARDAQTALDMTRRALALLERRRFCVSRDTFAAELAELRHRLQRLERKVGGGFTSPWPGGPGAHG